MSDNGQAPLTDGDFQLIAAERLTVIIQIQREPSADRVRQMARDLDPRKLGFLHVARITNGNYKGKLHIVDGGTRWRAVMLVDPKYLLRCMVEEMTYEEAADSFMSENGLGQKPNAFTNFKVGCVAGYPDWLAVKKALKDVGVEPTPGNPSYGANGTPGQLAAIAAAHRCVSHAYRLEPDWKTAGRHLAWALTMTRSAYVEHGQTTPGYCAAHDGDIIQALSFIGLTYPKAVGDADAEARIRHATTTWLARRNRLFQKGSEMQPHSWRLWLADQPKGKGSSAGSSSRGSQIGELIVRNHNSALKPMLIRR